MGSFRDVGPVFAIILTFIISVKWYTEKGTCAGIICQFITAFKKLGKHRGG